MKVGSWVPYDNEKYKGVDAEDQRIIDEALQAGKKLYRNDRYGYVCTEDYRWIALCMRRS